MNANKKRKWIKNEYYYLRWRYPNVPKAVLRQWANDFVREALRK